MWYAWIWTVACRCVVQWIDLEKEEDTGWNTEGLSQNTEPYKGDVKEPRHLASWYTRPIHYRSGILNHLGQCLSVWASVPCLPVSSLPHQPFFPYLSSSNIRYFSIIWEKNKHILLSQLPLLISKSLPFFIIFPCILFPLITSFYCLLSSVFAIINILLICYHSMLLHTVILAPSKSLLYSRHHFTSVISFLLTHPVQTSVSPHIFFLSIMSLKASSTLSLLPSLSYSLTHPPFFLLVSTLQYETHPCPSVPLISHPLAQSSPLTTTHPASQLKWVLYWKLLGGPVDACAT